MNLSDAKAVTALSHQLGYPLSVEETTQNISAVISNEERTAFVAEYNDRIVGWINASQAVMIEVMPYCEINGLVVDENFHAKGIGKLLIERIKQWAKEKGNNKLSLRCNVKRIEAHKFYSHIGFKDMKKQTNFVLDII